ncbi:MAG: hypothetical protein OEZ54_01975 [Gemmatimonadota bacterium]|nr:hypothetical protein [Gemmatimonadota bacterium]
MIRFAKTLLLAGVVLIVANPATGQVGHDPDNTPFRDLRYRQLGSVFGGYFTGGKGITGAGPADGPVVGVRWEFKLGRGPITGYGSVAGALMERDLLNPDEPPETRVFQTVNQRMVMVTGGLEMVLTGRKTWNGFAPYVGAGTGITVGLEVPQDSVFSFGNKLHFSPNIGVRAFAGRNFHFRLEARDVLWRLKYPTGFRSTPANDPTADPILTADQPQAEWVHHPVFIFAIGFTLRE